MKQSTVSFLFFISAVSMLFSSCLQRYTNYGVVGIPVSSTDNRIVVVVVAENNAVTHQENGGFRKTTYSTSYWLKQYETSTGKLLKKKKLIHASDNNNQTVTCYGAKDNTIWLYVDKLRAFDINELEETTNEEKIAGANGMKPGIFPYGDRLMRPAIEKGYIDFTSDNGDEYRLFIADGTIRNKENLPKEETGAEANIRRLLHDDDYGVRSDTLDNKVFILSKDSIEAKNTSPSNYSLHEVAYRMKLFRAGFSVKKLGMHNNFSYENLYRLGQETYLNPCFVKDTYQDNVIHLSSPGGFLLIHQDVPGEKSKAIISRIDKDGKKIWETSTPVSTKITDCRLCGKYCLISTNKDYMLSAFIGKDALCIIDVETGKLTIPSLEE